MPLHLHRPKPALDRPEATVTPDTDPARAATQLQDGHRLVVSERYGHGLDILEALRTQLEPPRQDAPYAQRQAFELRWREASRRLLAPVRQHRVDLEGAPTIGFLAELYPKLEAFGLPVVEIEDLANAWRRYDEGVHLAVLGGRIHPFYGTYAPTRTTHLELFATWLAGYDGPRTSAVDVGTGCGVLALMLARAGVERVLATDTNPNAVESVRRELARSPEPPPITARRADLMGKGRAPADLVVFNPPWTQGDGRRPLDRALTFDGALFPRFFAQAHDRVTPDGRVVLLFSTIMSLVQPDLPHPIEEELARGRFELVQKLQRRVKPSTGPDGGRRRTKERVEVWELRRR